MIEFDGDADAQSHAAAFGFAAFEADAEPVRTNFAEGARLRHLLEAEHLVVGKGAFDVGDRKSESGP